MLKQILIIVILFLTNGKLGITLRHRINLATLKSYFFLNQASPQKFEPSKNTNRPFTFTIFNDLVNPVTIQWVNFQGELQVATQLQSNSRFKENSYYGHTWVLKANGDTRVFHPNK